MNNDDISDEGSTDSQITRRLILKTAATTTAGAAVFSAPASATDVPVLFEIKCLGDEGEVTITSINGISPANLLDHDLRLYIGKESVVTPGGANDDEVDAIAEIGSCFFEEYTKECPSPIAILDNPHKPGDGSLVYTFDLAEAGLDTETSETSVVVAGVYQDSEGNLKEPENRYQSFDSLEDGQVFFDPATCCIECESDGLLVKYEYDEESGTFIVSEGGDDNIEFIEIGDSKEGEEGEPTEVCFASEYCELEAVVKAGTEESTETIDLASDGTRTTEFCVQTPNDKAISNIQFYCS